MSQEDFDTRRELARRTALNHAVLAMFDIASMKYPPSEPQWAALHTRARLIIDSLQYPKVYGTITALEDTLENKGEKSSDG